MNRLKTLLPTVLVAATLGACATTTDSASDVAAVKADVATRIPLDPAAFAVDVGDDPKVKAGVAALLSTPLSTDAAMRIALARNAEVRAWYESLGVARAEVVRAGLLQNPTLDVSAAIFEDGTDFELDAMQSLVSLFTAPLRRARAEAELAAAQANVKQRFVMLAFDIRRALLGVRTAEAVAALHRRDLATTEDVLDLRKKLAQVGNIFPQQLTEAEIMVAEVRLLLSAAESELLTAREPLNVLLGLYGEDALRWTAAAKPETAPPALPDDVEQAAIARSLDLALKQAELDAAVQATDAEAYESAFGDASAGVRVQRETDGETGVGPAVAVPLPIFDDGGVSRAKGAAKLRLLAAERSALGVEVRSAARVFRERLRSSAERAAFVEKALLPLAHRRTLEVLQQYNAMQIGAFDVLDARRDERKVERSLIELRDVAETAGCDLDELLAGSLRRERATAAAEASKATGEVQDSGKKKGH